MDTFWMIMAAMTVGFAAAKINDWLTAKEETKPALIAARRRVFHDRTITHDIALAAKRHIDDSEEIKRMLDYLVASLSDEANMDMIQPCLDPHGALIAAGKVQAAESMANAIEEMKNGKLAVKIAEAERKLQQISA